MNKQYRYATGRDYGTPQILEIAVDVRPEDYFEFVRVTFHDTARRISGTVLLLGLECFESDLVGEGIGPAVLKEYDAGRYDQI